MYIYVQSTNDMADFELIDKQLLACLEPLVGLSRTPSACMEALPVDVAKRASITTSKTGIYIDEDEGFNARMLLNGAGCEPGSQWDQLLQSRRGAIADIVLQISTSLNGTFQGREPRTLSIGETGYQTTMNIPAQRLSFQLQTANIPGGVITVQHLGFLAVLPYNSPETYQLIKVKRVGDANDIAAYNWRVDNVYNSFLGQKPDTDAYPLPDGGFTLICDGSTYEVYYDYNGTSFSPVDNALRCVTCINSSHWVSPFFRVLPAGRANGITLSATFSCNDQYIACALTENRTLRALISEMIVARTIQLWLSRQSAKATTGTTAQQVVGANQSQSLIQAYGALYLNKLQFLTEQYNIADTKMGCFSCRPSAFASNYNFVVGYPDIDDNIPTVYL